MGKDTKKTEIFAANKSHNPKKSLLDKAFLLKEMVLPANGVLCRSALNEAA
ncbi:hypothetical protein [Cyclobacterium jeungdonense]|uniref:hypothetical protein n=1 Tax=Cyclobacterium jeungdonense TaxID=708087 RepID=UPI0013D0E75F|nr:hypothetical protein [Cyclobacterium jeungdonense]